MIDRRLFFIGAIGLALIVLSLFGLPPKVLWQKVQDFASGANSAASATLKQSQQREKRFDEAGKVLDGLPGENKNKWAEPRPRN